MMGGNGGWFAGSIFTCFARVAFILLAVLPVPCPIASSVPTIYELEMDLIHFAFDFFFKMPLSLFLYAVGSFGILHINAVV